MHKARTSIALVVFAASCLCAKADLNWFLRPEMGRLDFPSRHYSNEPCYGIEIGRQFGPQGAHEVNLEWTRSNLEYSAFPDPKLIGGASIIASGHIQPILVGYRYYFGPAGSRLRFFAGPSFGMAKASVDVSYWADLPVQFRGTTDRWRFCSGGKAGLALSLTPKCSLQIGYRYLLMTDLGYFNTSGSSSNYNDGAMQYAVIRLNSINATHLFFSALSFSF